MRAHKDDSYVGLQTFPMDSESVKVYVMLCEQQKKGNRTDKEITSLEISKRALAGLSMRDYFAAAFVASGHIFTRISTGDLPELVAEQAYVMADAMMKERFQ